MDILTYALSKRYIDKAIAAVENIECKVVEVKELGTHHMFIAEVVAVRADEKYMDEKGKFHLEYSKPIAYSHGTYFSLGEELGKFGYSVRKK